MHFVHIINFYYHFSKDQLTLRCGVLPVGHDMPATRHTRTAQQTIIIVDKLIVMDSVEIRKAISNSMEDNRRPDCVNTF